MGDWADDGKNVSDTTAGMLLSRIPVDMIASRSAALNAVVPNGGGGDPGDDGSALCR